MDMETTPHIIHGIKENKHQFLLNLVQIFLVGLTIGMMRVVVPSLAETEFGISDNFVLLTTFVVVFGAIKAIMNLFAGKLSEIYGRKTLMLWGWVIALPIPFLLLWAPSWNWIILATVLLGFNQGLCWSMALNSKLDLAKSNQKGFVNGVNEFSGYVAVGLAGVITAYLAQQLGAKEGLFWFSLIVILTGLLLAKLTLVETLPWAKEHHKHALQQTGQAIQKSLAQLFHMASLKDKNLVALNQAGLIEKFVDALIWIFLPIYLLNKGLSLVEAGAIIAIYGITWGVGQLITGPLSDKIGRKSLIVWGMWLCGFGVLSIPLTEQSILWSLEAMIIGVGMAMLYPNLGAAIGDYAPVQHQASLIGIYRFWRDSGYAFGALAMGIMAQWSQNLDAPFWLVGLLMLLSGLWLKIQLKRP